MTIGYDHAMKNHLPYRFLLVTRSFTFTSRTPVDDFRCFGHDTSVLVTWKNLDPFDTMFDLFALIARSDCDACQPAAHERIMAHAYVCFLHSNLRDVSPPANGPSTAKY
jgi:hypothetical protein